jgi:hypothetical protein
VYEVPEYRERKECSKAKGMEDKRAEINKLVEDRIPKGGDRTYSYTPWSKLRLELLGQN